MVSTKEELVASTLRKQIAYLEGLLKEIESEQDSPRLVSLRMRDVETQIRKLRTKLGN